MSNYSVRYSYCPLGWAGADQISDTEAFSKGTRGSTFLPLEKQKKDGMLNKKGAVLVTRGLRLLNGLTATLTSACSACPWKLQNSSQLLLSLHTKA